MFLSARARSVMAAAALGLGLVLLYLGGIVICVPAHAQQSPSQAITQAWTSSASIAITPDGQRLLVVNPDSNSISLIATASSTVLSEIEVGLDPRAIAVSPTGERAFVVNQGSDDLSVLDISAGVVVADIPLADRPVGVALSPDGQILAVAELGADQIRFLDAEQLGTLSVQPVADRPHGLVFTPDGNRLLVTHLLSGQVTLLDVLPYRSYLPLIGRALLPTQASGSQWVDGDHSYTLQTSGGLVSVATWPNVAPAPAVIVNSSGTRAYLAQTMANGQGFNTQFDTTVFPKVSVINLETEVHQTSEHISLPEVDQPVGLPWHLALAPGETELWVVNAASNDVSVVDLSNPVLPQRIANLPVGDNPRGLVFSPDGSAAYVNNTLGGTVSVIDTAAYAVTQVITVTENPLPAVLLQGKRLFHSSARTDLAQARWISCNTCHIEGEHDGRTWQIQYLGEVPPGATPIITRNTTSLLGMIETYPLRWSAEWDESADSEFSIRFEQFGSGLIHGGDLNPTLGPPNQGRSADLDALAAFIDSLTLPSSAQVFNAAAQRGKAIFESPVTGCLDCHPPPLYTDLQLHDVGTADAEGEYFGPQIDTPTLRFLFDSAPYLHDGSAADLLEVLTETNPQDEHGITSHLTSQELNDLVEFLLALPFE
jgi:YVTN family beta-propeller protein